MGDVDYKPVAEGNIHASVAAFLFALASLRRVLPVIENPAGSMIFRFPSLKLVTTFFSAADALCCRCVFAQERMGKRFKKAYKLVGHAWVKHLCAPCRCKNGVHCSLVHRIVRYGVVRISGRRQLLRESAAYPRKMGVFVIRMWQKYGSSSSTASRVANSMDWKHPAHSPQSERCLKLPNASSLSWKRPSPEDTPMASTVKTLSTVQRPSDDRGASTDGWKRPTLESFAPEGGKRQKSSVTASRAQSSSAWKTPDL